jgi:hypothetical protein
MILLFPAPASSLAPHASLRGEVAQLVEHTTENRSVDSSILSLATIFNINNFTDRVCETKHATALLR